MTDQEIITHLEQELTDISNLIIETQKEVDYWNNRIKVLESCSKVKMEILAKYKTQSPTTKT